MKKLNISSGILLSAILLSSSCKKFEDMNYNPKEASADQVQVEYFINNSIIGAQMDPHIAERVFVLYWKTASHQHLTNGITSGNQDDGWNTDYYRYISGWLNSITTAIQIADEKKANGSAFPWNENLKQVARIWRAYLMSEMADNFGPIPINGFQGTNPEFADVKTVYYFILDELKDASAKLDITLTPSDELKKTDPAYAYNYARWQKYANSMRLRLAMRLSEVDATKAKAEFQDAASKPLITSMDDAFQVAERPNGWDPLSGVMSREWNAQILSTTLENIYTGLGGMKSADLLGANAQSHIKPADYAGLKLTDHFSTKTNDPFAGYWLDGIPFTMDPRAFKAFPLAGDFTNPDFCKYPSYDQEAWETTTADLNDANGNSILTLNGAFTWNGSNGGAWGVPGSRNGWRGWPGAAPRLALKFRNSTNKRVFFAPWETYFLMAEASLKGWTVPMSAEDAYTAGVQASFDYWGIGGLASTYLNSEEYNRLGTSVKWSHITEPPASYTVNYKNGYTNAAGTATILYPVNNLYKNGAVKNDQLTKVITQKYIAQVPWLPLESWNDQRRLGLPFFENPNAEAALPNMPDLNSGNYMTGSVKFFPQRLKYPASLKNTNSKGYDQAVAALGGADNVLTPLWWAKK